MKKTVLQIIILIILSAFLADWHGKLSNPEEWRIHSQFFAGYLGAMTPIFLTFILSALIPGLFSLIKKLSTGKWWKYMMHFTWGIFLTTQIILFYGGYKRSIDSEAAEISKEVPKEKIKPAETKKKGKYDDLFEELLNDLDSVAKEQSLIPEDWNLISKDGIKISIPNDWSHHFQEDSAGLFNQIVCYDVKNKDFCSIMYTSIAGSPKDQLYYTIENFKQNEAYKNASFSKIEKSYFKEYEIYESSLTGSFYDKEYSGKLFCFRSVNSSFIISIIGGSSFIENIAPKILNSIEINQSNTSDKKN
jgi:hypothetical protein